MLLYGVFTFLQIHPIMDWPGTAPHRCTDFIDHYLTWARPLHYVLSGEQIYQTEISSVSLLAVCSTETRNPSPLPGPVLLFNGHVRHSVNNIRRIAGSGQVAS